MQRRLVKNKIFFAVLLFTVLHGVAVPVAFGASSSTNVTSHICNADFAAPVIMDPSDGGTTESSKVTVRGTGEVGMTVTLLVNDAAKATTIVAGNGSFAVQVPLAVGNNVLVAREKDGCDNIKDSPDVGIARQQKSEPTSPGESTGSGKGGTPSQNGLSANRFGRFGSLPNVSGDSIGSNEEPSTNENVGAEVPKITNLKEGEHVNSDLLWIAGTGQPGSIIIIYVNGKEVARVVVGEDGTYGVEVTLNLGENTIKAVEIHDGKRVATRTWHVTYLRTVSRQLFDNRWIIWVTALMAVLLALLVAWLGYRHHEEKRKEKGV